MSLLNTPTPHSISIPLSLSTVFPVTKTGPVSNYDIRSTSLCLASVFVKHVHCSLRKIQGIVKGWVGRREGEGVDATIDISVGVIKGLKPFFLVGQPHNLNKLFFFGPPPLNNHNK